MNDFLAFAAASANEVSIVLRRPDDGGAVDISAMRVPFETLKDIAYDPEAFVDRIRGFVSLVEAGLIDLA